MFTAFNNLLSMAIARDSVLGKQGFVFQSFMRIFT